MRNVGGGRYRQIDKHYYSVDEQFWKWRKEKAYELHPENATREIGNTRIEEIDVDSGAPLERLKYSPGKTGTYVLKEGQKPTYTPQALFKMLAGEHIKQAGKSVMGGNTNLVMCLLCVAVGAMLGLLIGMNLPALTSTFSGNGTKTATQIVLGAWIH